MDEEKYENSILDDTLEEIEEIHERMLGDIYEDNWT